MARQQTKKSTAKKRATSQAPKGPVGTCFVLMPFREPFNTYYRTIIEPAVKEVKLRPLRGDSLFKPTPIMGDIWQMIQDAKVLIAELTGKNANVFYELGLGHAIGKPIVLVSETMEDVPFDLQPLRVIPYDKDHPEWGKTLREKLIAALRETLDDTAQAVPPMFRKMVQSQAPEESELSIRLLNLERKVSSLSDRRFLKDESRRVRHWMVEKLVESASEDPGGFLNREEAVAWTVARLRHGESIEEIRKTLSDQLLDDDERGKVLEIASSLS